MNEMAKIAVKDKAADLYANEPGITHELVARRCGGRVSGKLTHWSGLFLAFSNDTWFCQEG